MPQLIKPECKHGCRFLQITKEEERKRKRDEERKKRDEERTSA
jgi:uncharacterized protein YutD